MCSLPLAYRLGVSFSLPFTIIIIMTIYDYSVDWEEVDVRYQEAKDAALEQEAFDQQDLARMWTTYKSRLFTILADALPADQLFARSFLRALAQLVYKRDCRNHLQRIQTKGVPRRQYDDHPF